MHSDYVQIAPRVEAVRELLLAGAPAVLDDPRAVLLGEMRLTVAVRVIAVVEEVGRLDAVVPADDGHGVIDLGGLVGVVQPFVSLGVEVLSRLAVLPRHICVRRKCYRHGTSCQQLLFDRVGRFLIISAVDLRLVFIFVDILGLVKYRRIRQDA